MKRMMIGAALAAAALFAVLTPAASTAQTARDAEFAVTDRTVMHDGARLVAPGEDPVQIFETATPTQFTPDGTVDVPWGDWLAQLLNAAIAIIAAAALWLLRKLPTHMVAALDMFSGMMGQGRVNELIEKAVTYGVNTTAGAVRGKTLKVGVGNEVLERAFEYAMRHAPGLVAKLGGMVALREKIIARLDLEEDAAIPTPRPPAESLISTRAPQPSET